MRRATSMRRLRATPGEVAAQKQAREAKGSAVRTVAIGVAISVISAALVGIGIRVFRMGDSRG